MAFGDIIRQAASPGTSAAGMGGMATKIWHCDVVEDKIYELSVVDFSMVRQVASPGNIPQGLGGDLTKIWHCDREDDRYYELSVTDFSVVRFETSLGGYPAGIGGDASTIWHCDTVATPELYCLSPTDFSVIRSGASTDEFPYGIGGITGAVMGSGTGSDRVYGLSATDFSVQVWASGPGADQRGIGGTNLKIWHCDWNLQKVYELDTGAAAPAAPTAPTVLWCNGQANPVDVLPAYFSAIYNDPNMWDIADYYRLQVNKTSDFTGQMLWDSGKTAMSNVNEGERCSNISYGGQALSLNKLRYYWRIKFWDDGGLEGVWSAIGATHFTMAGSGAGETGAGPWEEDIVDPTGEVKVEIPMRSGEWTTLDDIMKIHTSINKNPLDAIEIAQAEVICSNIDKHFNSFEEASAWYKELEGYAIQVSVGCEVGGTPISQKFFTGIICSVSVARLSQTAEVRIVDFLDYFGRIFIESTPMWQDISLTQLYKNLVELAFTDWVEGIDYFVEDLGDITVQAISYENLNLLTELKHIAECRGMRIFTDVNGRLVCRSRSLEGEPWDIRYDYNLEDVDERRDIGSVLNWVVVHARPHEILPDTTPPGKITDFTATPGDEKIDLTWSNPTDDDFEKVKIQFSTGGYPPDRNDGTNVYEGTGESKSHTGLVNGTRYYYSAFSVDDVGNWSGPAHASAVAGVGGDAWEDDTTASPVLNFRAYGEETAIIRLTWTNPKVSDYDETVIRWDREDSPGVGGEYPQTPTDGLMRYWGGAEHYNDQVTKGYRYFYTAFVKTNDGRYSEPRFASAIASSSLYPKGTSS